MHDIVTKETWSSDPDNAPLPSDFNRIESNTRKVEENRQEETTARQTADTTLQNNIDAEEAAREDATAASELLTRIKTVDGTGSGLDSDLLDGKHLSSILGSFPGIPFISTMEISSAGVHTLTNMAIGEIRMVYISAHVAPEIQMPSTAGRLYIVAGYFFIFGKAGVNTLRPGASIAITGTANIGGQPGDWGGAIVCRIQ